MLCYSHCFFFFFFFFNDTATTEIYTLSLHDALPISRASGRSTLFTTSTTGRRASSALRSTKRVCGSGPSLASRSEEHTSELQSPCNLVCRLLLEKKKKTKIIHSTIQVTTPRCIHHKF